jgi:hypothetical protein
MTSPIVVGNEVYVYGVGEYRNSDIYLMKQSVANFGRNTGAEYFAGLRIYNAQVATPIWRPSESAAVPIVTDLIQNGQSIHSIGNLSVAFVRQLGLFVMTFDGGRTSPSTAGVYFTYSSYPAGPWAPPQLIYSASRDGGYGTFIRQAGPNGQGRGPAGPTIGNQATHNPQATTGGTFAPELIGRFCSVNGRTLRIYYTMSTWNPYTVVLMHSDFNIRR